MPLNPVSPENPLEELSNLTFDVPILSDDESHLPQEDHEPVVEHLHQHSDGTPQISVTSFSTLQIPNTHTVFLVSVSWDRRSSWKLSKRYSEFAALHESLSRKIGNLPPFPPKRWIFKNDPDFLSGRRHDLDNYIRALVRISPVLCFPEVQKFLKTMEHGIRFSPQDNTVPQKVSQFRDPQFGFNSIDIDFKSGIALSVQEDSDAVSKVDSLLMNIRMPWEKESANVPIGCLTMWKRNSKGDWNSIAVKNYDCQASALCWNKEKNIVFVGLQTGIIKQYRISPETGKIVALEDITSFTKRVTAIYHDNSKKRMISCSRDRSGLLWNTQIGQLASCSRLDESFPMSMFVDKETSRVFVGLNSGNISIFDYSRDILKLSHTLVGGHVSTVRALYFDPRESYLFSGGFDFSIVIWKIGPPGDESLNSRKVGVLSGGPPSKIKSVVFCPKRRHVFSGHDNGCVAIWSTRDGSLLNVFDAGTSGVVNLQWWMDEEKLLTECRDGYATLWSLGNSIPIVQHPPVFVKRDLYAQIMLSKS